MTKTWKRYLGSDAVTMPDGQKFVGWGVKKNKLSRGGGLLSMAPPVDLEAAPILIKRSKVDVKSISTKTGRKIKKSKLKCSSG